MIGRLTGQILEKQPGQLVLDVAGVGYEVEISLNTFAELGALSADGKATAGDLRPVSIYTHLVIRDDAHTLFGFSTERERQLESPDGYK